MVAGVMIHYKLQTAVYVYCIYVNVLQIRKRIY